MAQQISVKLSRFDGAPWGFRLQGGKDFAQPLVIQKVNGNSPAEKAGLQAGDALIRVNTTDLFNLTHKEAQNALVRAGNNFELTVQRGGSTWKPSVTPVGPAPVSATSNLQPVTKTSLAYKQAPAPAIGSQHNTAAKPFTPGPAQINGESAKNLASKLYNSPVGLYSEETIAETLSAQTEVLAGGVLGVNFKKNEKTYNAANSEVLKMVQEIDNEPREPEPAVAAAPMSAPSTPKTVPVMNPIAGLRHVAPPEPKPEPTQDPLKVLPPGQNICADCERLIVGLFVRIKDKNLHVECFKCATCGTSLKNAGYYNINNKLYCDVHAKLAARQNPPAPNLEPVTIPPGIKPPSSIIGSALSSAPYQPSAQTPLQSFQTSQQPQTPGSPLPGTLGPLPFHAPHSGIRHVNAPRNPPFHPQTPPVSQPSLPAIPPPKLNFGQAAAPAPRPLSEVQADAAVQYQSFSTVTQSSYSAASQSVSYGSSNESHKKMSICSQEVDSLHMDTQNVVKQLSEILEERCPSPTPIDEAVKRNNQASKDEEIQRLEQTQQWKNYQSNQVTKNLTMQSSGLAFLRSHSTPVAELEALYEQQLYEIEEQQEIIKKLGVQKRMSVDETQIRLFENKIMESQNEIFQKQKRLEEIEKKKRVRFEEEEEIRRGSLQVDEQDVQPLQEVEQQRVQKQEQDRQVQNQQQKQRQEPERRALDDQRRKLEEEARLDEQRRWEAEEHNRLMHAEALREHARTPVADLEAYERHDEMSRKTEAIYHTYEHLVQAEVEEEMEHLNVVAQRPVTPNRAMSPFPGSIPGAEKSLLLKNIQGIQFEFDLKKPEHKQFKLPDLRNLSNAKPYAPSADPSSIPAAAPPVAPPRAVAVPPPPTVAAPQPPQVAAPPPPQVAPTPPETLLYKPSTEDPPVSQEVLQKQQIKQQRNKVHEELALNERFRKKQERLGAEPQRFERSKTPVAELEDEFRHHQSTERTHHVYESYDQVIQAADRPRSRIGQPVPENQSITDAEKSLFFQNISGINYEFENISELTAAKHQPVEQKSVFIRDVEDRTKSPMTVGINDYSKKITPQWTPKPDPYQTPFVQALTTMPEPRKTYEQFRQEQEALYKQQKQNQQSYYQQATENQGLGSNKPALSPFVKALQIAPDRPYSPLPASLPVQQKLEDIPQAQAQDPSPPLPEKYDLPRRRSSGFPGVNVQRTPYQMLRGSQIQSTFMDDLVSQQSAISQFMSEQEETSTKVHRKDTIDSAFGLMPAQVAYAPPPPPEKRAELIASQAQFGSSMKVKCEQTKLDTKPLPKPVTMTEALTIAPDKSYCPFAEIPKPQATIIGGGAAVALTKDVESVQRQVIRPQHEPIQIKPNYEVKDLQLNKNIIQGEYTGFVENQSEKSAEGGVIEGKGVTGSYQIQEEKSSSVIQLEKQSEEIPSAVGFPPVSNELKAQFTECKQSASAQQSTLQTVSNEAQFTECKQSAIAQQSTHQTVSSESQFTECKQSASAEQSSLQTEKVETVGGVTKTTKRRVVEVAESSHKELTQVRVIGSRDPVSGLRRTSNEVCNKSSGSSAYQSVSASGLHKPSTLPTYQNMITVKPDSEPVSAVSAPKVDAQDIKPRPRSAIGGRVSQPEPVRVPTAFRSRTPVPLPKIDYTPKYEPKPQIAPTYNQDQVYRSASPRPIPVPKAQFGSYVGPQPHHSILKPGSTVFRTSSPLPVPSMRGSVPVQPQQPHLKPADTCVYRSTSPVPVPPIRGYMPVQPHQSHLKPADTGVYRSTSPVPVPKMVKTTETYQQPMPSWRVQPVKTEKRVSWPPKEEPAPQLGELPAAVTQSCVRAKVSQQEEQAQKNIEEARKSSITSRGSVSMEETRKSSIATSSRGSISMEEARKSSIATPSRGSISVEEARKSSIATPSRSSISYEEPVAPTTSVKAMVTQKEQQEKINIEEARRSSLSKNEQERRKSEGLVQKTSLIGKGQPPTPKHDPIVAPRPFGTPTPQRKIATPHFQPITPVAITEGQTTAISAPKLTFSSSQTSTTSSLKTSLTLAASSASAFKPPDAVPVLPVKPVATRPAPAPVSVPSSVPPASVDNGAGAGPGGNRGATFGGVSAPKRGRGVLNPPNSQRVPLCASCNGQVRGPFITALGKIWCPEHFVCSTAQCRRPLADIGFVEEQNQLYCEFCFEKYIAPNCDKCSSKIKGDCLNAIGKHFHPECFTCAYCGKLFGNSAFFLEDGLPYCENDWNELFTTKCFACGFPIEAGDRWVEALNNNYHSQCFNCTVCKKNLEGQSFFAKGGRPFCKAHAR